MEGKVISVRLDFGISHVSDASTAPGNYSLFALPHLKLVLFQVIPTTLEKYVSGGVYLLLAIRAQLILQEGTRILSGGQVLSLRYLQCKYYSPCSLRVFAMQRERA